MSFNSLLPIADQKVNSGFKSHTRSFSLFISRFSSFSVPLLNWKKEWQSALSKSHLNLIFLFLFTLNDQEIKQLHVFAMKHTLRFLWMNRYFMSDVQIIQFTIIEFPHRSKDKWVSRSYSCFFFVVFVSRSTFFPASCSFSRLIETSIKKNETRQQRKSVAHKSEHCKTIQWTKLIKLSHIVL